jgi:hypothetical protein
LIDGRVPGVVKVIDPEAMSKRREQRKAKRRQKRAEAGVLSHRERAKIKYIKKLRADRKAAKKAAAKAAPRLDRSDFAQHL